MIGTAEWLWYHSSFVFPKKLLNGNSFLCRGTVVMKTQWSCFALLLKDLKMGSILDSLFDL
jgi:hypothetical protein